ncbi:F-box/LRR-repeat protein At3g26922-like isoform X2 [Abrus precatorius]|nr:F-box/LRR-repeat protein At3g26922-like isoform X2 [Abrus precatorius]
MDASSLISNKKHRNPHDREGKNESGIRICDLPDPILQLIISSLPTKEAVRTSVLSKRWEYLWMGISKIKLREGAPEKRQQFVDFVRRLLVDCDCSNLTKFSLSCKVGDGASEVNEWLRGFINPQIQELNLSFEGIEEPLVFPDHLFACATLTKFELSMQHIFKLPSSILFESLRILSLVYITFPDYSSTQRLFSGCPSLEELSLVNCNWVNVESVCISSPVLQKLMITEWREEDDDKFDEDDDIGGQNVSNCCNVVIVGTNLKSFSYDGHFCNDYFLYSSTSVINASIEVHALDFSDEDWESDVGYSVFKLLKALSNVERLSISEIALLAIDSTASLLGYLPLFCNLAELEVSGAASPIRLSCEAMLTILRNSPCLQVVHFHMGGVSLPKNCANNNHIMDPLPVCFKTNLKTIKIYCFSGSDDELNAIKFLLQEASVLDKIYIYCSSFEFDSPAESKRLKKLYKQIVRFPRESMDCKIILKYF